MAYGLFYYQLHMYNIILYNVVYMLLDTDCDLLAYIMESVNYEDIHCTFICNI